MVRNIFLAVWLIAASLPLASCARTPASVEAAQQAAHIRWAYYVADDPASLASLRQRGGDLDYVALHWATMRADGSVEVKAAPEVIQLVRSLGAKPILSVTVGGSADVGHAILATDSSRSVAVDSLAAALPDYDGISIDFEGLYAEDRDSLTRFMAQLAARLRPAGKLVTMALSAKTSDSPTGWAAAHDYAALNPNVDLFVLMAYGFRTARSTVPGSTAPMPWVEACLSFALSQVGPEKLLLGVPLFGYDWDTTAGTPARALRYADAIDVANQAGVAIQYDQAQQSARFSYVRDGHSHEVWFEDRDSVDARVALVDRYHLAGVAGWRLGHEDPGVWSAINTRFQSPAMPPTLAAGTATPPATTSTPPAIASTSPVGVSTPPATTGARSLYFAEGSTAPPFDTWLLLQNPGPAPVMAHLTFMLEGGRVITRDMLLGPTSRTSIFANQIVPSSAFSTRIDADQPLFAERAMYAGFDGHVVTAVTGTSRTWYFAEGATASPFHTWILLQNPNSVPAAARLIYSREDGSASTQLVGLQPNSRSSVFVNQVLPDAAFSTRVESDQPIIAERAMYRFPGNASTGVTGVPEPARTWFFAAGLPTFRGVPVDCWLLLQNPNGYPVTASVTFFGTDGQTFAFQKFLPPASRQSVFASQMFRAPSFGMRVEATGEIIAEKSVFMGPTASSGNEPQGACATQGTPRLGTTWVLPEGSTAPPFSEKISLLNPNSSSTTVRFEFMLEGGQMLSQTVDVGAMRSFDLDVATVVRSAPASARVVTSLPTVVERTMFWVKGGKIGAHNTVGIRLE